MPCPVQRRKNTYLQTERLHYRETRGEDVGKIVWGSEWPASTIQNRRAWGRNQTRYPRARLRQAVHSHRLPRHSVADSPTPFPAVEISEFCQNHSCPVNYCYNHGHCDISGPPDCQPTCTCAPAFTGNRCFLAGNNFTPIIYKGMADCSCCASPSRLSCLGMMGTLVYEA